MEKSGAYSPTRYRKPDGYATRFWSVMVNGELLAVTVYRKGAEAVASAITSLNDGHPVPTRDGQGAPKQAAQAFRDLLHAAQLDSEVRKVELANPVVVDAIRPMALASKQDDLLYEAWRAASIASDDADRRVPGFQDALK